MLRFVVITGQPISIVSNEDILFLIGKLNDKHQCAGRKKFSYDLLPKKFLEFKEKIIYIRSKTSITSL